MAKCLELLAQRQVGKEAYCDHLGHLVLVSNALDQGASLIQIWM